jgi:hypothetical protein
MDSSTREHRGAVRAPGKEPSEGEGSKDRFQRSAAEASSIFKLRESENRDNQRARALVQERRMSYLAEKWGIRVPTLVRDVVTSDRVRDLTNTLSDSLPPWAAGVATRLAALDSVSQERLINWGMPCVMRRCRSTSSPQVAGLQAFHIRRQESGDRKAGSQLRNSRNCDSRGVWEVRRPLNAPLSKACSIRRVSLPPNRSRGENAYEPTSCPSSHARCNTWRRGFLFRIFAVQENSKE